MSWHVGIDENGLGPLLGPLLVTGVMARSTPEADRLLQDNPQHYLHARLTDSKELVNHRRMALGEAWARVVCSAIGSAEPACPSDVVQCLSLSDLGKLQIACPGSTHGQCWSPEGETFEASSGEMASAKKDFDVLGAQGLQVVWARSVIVCTRSINDGLTKGRSRMDLDLMAMEELVSAARATSGEPIHAVCGKVGGLMRYPAKFTKLDGHLVSVLEENPNASSYVVAGVGEVSFLKDADSKNPLVALSSLLGKYMREVLMNRIVRYYRRQDGSLPDASGYNDPVTMRFVRDTEKIRTEQGIVERCFRREQASRR